MQYEEDKVYQENQIFKEKRIVEKPTNVGQSVKDNSNVINIFLYSDDEN